MGVRVLYFRQCLPLSMDGKGASPGDELAANGRSRRRVTIDRSRNHLLTEKETLRKMELSVD